ncbi:hypothetical protein IKG54_00930 [Candidatus Saccharibacteria bacterium]|nr:hypothetical protein [Candidatus Saccharibacteria bacterium]
MDKKNNKGKILIGVVCVLVLAVGTYFVGYQVGKTAGAADKQSALEGVAATIKDKSDFIKKMSELYNGWRADTETIDKDGINNYINKLNELMQGATNDAVKTALNDYLATWQKLATAYDTQNNEDIMKAFEEVKVSATDTAEKVQKALDEKINEAMNKIEE